MTKKNAQPDPAAKRSRQNNNGLSELASEIASIKDTLAQGLTDSTTQRGAFDALYAELKQYKEDFIYQNEKSLLLDLLLFYDSLNWFQASLIKKEMSPEVVADSFQYLLDEMLELLYRRDVLPMEATDAFDRQRQKVIKTVEAESLDEDYAIQSVLKRGFTRGDRVLRAEEVVVKRFPNTDISEA